MTSEEFVSQLREMIDKLSPEAITDIVEPDNNETTISENKESNIIEEIKSVVKETVNEAINYKPLANSEIDPVEEYLNRPGGFLDRHKKEV